MERNAEQLAAPHINAFNRFLSKGVPKIAREFVPVHVIDKFGNTLSVSVDGIQIENPIFLEKQKKAIEKRALPSDCRRTARSYSGEIFITFVVETNGVSVLEKVPLGHMPIMVKSNLCYLAGMSETELLQAKEDPREPGGYFIANGLEKICRFIQTQKKYILFGIFRPSFTKKCKGATEHAVGFKSLHRDGRVSSFFLHYVSDHSVLVRVRVQTREYYVSLAPIIRALSGRTDKEIYRAICSSIESDSSLEEYAELLLQSFSFHKEYTQNEACEYLGRWFKVLYAPGRNSISLDGKPSETSKLLQTLPENDEDLKKMLEKHLEVESDLEYGERFLRETIAVHLENNEEKFSLLILALVKLFKQVSGKISPDNSDSLMHHEIVTPGDLFTEILADRMIGIRNTLQKNLLGNIILRDKPIIDSTFIRLLLKNGCGDTSYIFKKLLTTGNLSVQNQNNFVMMQQTGFSIIAERLNYLRFFSHLRSVHRGAYFQDIRTTTVRKLLPDLWGFICPVHTPDGAPCGLLTHLSHRAEVSSSSKIIPINDLIAFGMVLSTGFSVQGIPVVQNGVVHGSVHEKNAEEFIRSLRRKKIHSKKYAHIEVFYQNSMTNQKLIGIIGTPSRIMRPVINIEENAIEYIGTTEQVFLQIENLGTTDTPKATHREMDKTSIMSIVAGSTPLGNFNPSPRNMYQCQMAKQSMGTPPYSQKYRSDQKTYSLDYPQIPMFHTNLYREYNLGQYPTGKNITIAIVSYTGYDLEDAVILNKASVDRGFMRGCILKTEEVSLAGVPSMVIGNLKGEDGLPCPGKIIKDGEVKYTKIDTQVLAEINEKNKTMEDQRVERVAIFDDETGKRGANIHFRTERIPTIGDKFSSRHGQKGVCSIFYEDEDMPFSENGMTPDLIINPHAFPSRMSIGMFIEALATKVGAYEGAFQDGTMFKYGENEENAHVYFGDLLEKHGFRRGGGETLYSGITGKPLKVNVFFGMVYYQRLRHMVNDKYQVRAQGPIHNLTKQPIGGRKRAGGIRLGEMERDVLIAHGASSIIQDRFMACSDYSVQNVCKKCKSLCFFHVNRCVECNSASHLVRVEFPYVFKYLLTELASVNIKCKLSIKSI
ncbi:DNA-directed RNA polymerase I subunit RPA2 [Nematocida sp. LUAm3]|nr:DNA-directed RNA polymerase I subunit RPA2 [Nematocida sp. LUAm3]KAI5175826.1 DNA-directed RNA polymerase I subunit RPA2 [Nematocida sp. LUAm2]KAI5178322.1 DNA-directed RNA polymerase I subunit RPA2 [Nematocida sp. LUAm1]